MKRPVIINLEAIKYFGAQRFVYLLSSVYRSGGHTAFCRSACPE